MFKVKEDIFHHFIDLFGTLNIEQLPDIAGTSSIAWLVDWNERETFALEFKKGILTLETIDPEIFDSIWWTPANSEFSLTVDNPGTDNGSICIKSRKKPHRKEVTHNGNTFRLFN